MPNAPYVKIIAANKLFGPSTLSIDGVDVSRYVKGFTVVAAVGELTRVELRLTSGVRLELDGVELKVVESPSPAGP